MAHHQNDELDRVRGATFLQLLPAASNTASLGDEEVPPDADEPPDDKNSNKLHKGQTSLPWSSPDAEYNKHTPRMDRKQSLLTRGLTFKSNPTQVEQDLVATGSIDLTRGLSTASNYSNASAASTADLTSDGHTSPDRANSPSPPLPPANFRGLDRKSGAGHVKILDKDGAFREAVPMADPVTRVEPGMEDGLGRKRCIRFACGRTPAQEEKDEKKVETGAITTPQPERKNKRTSSLRFACPSRLMSGGDSATKRVPLSRSPAPAARVQHPDVSARSHRGSEATLTDAMAAINNENRRKNIPEHSIADTDRSELHDQSGADENDEDWNQEPVYHGKKLTLHDFLKKEDKFRRLGEEAEEEALQDEEDLDEEANEDDDDDDDDDDDGDDAEDGSDQSEADDGNETDDEEGFAASDGESEAGSEYMFWTPARDSTDVSNDFIEPIRPTAPRAASVSSIDSGHVPLRNVEASPAKKPRKGSRPRKIRPGTPELPDSTDFVCGTLDEDRPLEAAYLSCMEERRRSKHIVIPQDIDPSFPTSDPEDKDEDDNEDEDNEHLLLHGNLDEDDISLHEVEAGRGRKGLHGRSSPKQPPAPVHQSQLHHSPPPPRKVQGQSPRRLRSPPPRRRLKSPPQLRKTLIATSPKSQAIGINYGSLSSRPSLTHTTSLPRSPAPITRSERPSAAILHHASQTTLATSGDTVIAPAHNRGAIDIVKGLEKKRQRRREKLAQKCHHRAAKEKARKPLPGKGAERMKEVGEQKAGRGRHNVLATKYPKYVLSI